MELIQVMSSQDKNGQQQTKKVGENKHDLDVSLKVHNLHICSLHPLVILLFCLFCYLSLNTCRFLRDYPIKVGLRLFFLTSQKVKKKKCACVSYWWFKLIAGTSSLNSCPFLSHKGDLILSETG